MTDFAGRARRFAGYGAVGVTGIPIDLAVVELVARVGGPYLVATLAGYLLAMTWNWVWQRQLVFEPPDGSIGREFARYLGADAAGALVRVGVVLIAVEGGVAGALATAGPGSVATVASALGIAFAAVTTFLMADTYVFE